ncbi:MAG: hypothetical protein M1831_003945 [Alyxoria varia]|nr:MAG: hypothetical protein M1831_003945 [Alyxoria varia]
MATSIDESSVKLRSDRVLTIGASVQINAPASRVFQLHGTPETWPDWNSFAPECVKHERASDPGTSGDKDVPSKEMVAVGDKVTFRVRMTPGGGFNGVTVVISEVYRPGDQETGREGQSNTDEDAFGITWYPIGLPQFLLRGTRWTEIRDLGEGKCEFKTWECQAGPLAYMVKSLYGKTLQERFEDWANDLKKKAEESERGGRDQAGGTGQ